MWRQNIMYKICGTEQSIARQRQLEQGLLQVMLTGAYEDVSISDLCDRLQIPRKTFYRYFSSKEGALYALIDHTIMDFYAGGDRGPETGTPRGDFQHFFEFWYEKRKLLDALSRNGLTDILSKRVMTLVQQEGLIQKNFFTGGEIGKEIMLSFALCGLMSMIFRWHEMGFPIPPAEMSQMAMRILSRPLFQI